MSIFFFAGQQNHPQLGLHSEGICTSQHFAPTLPRCVREGPAEAGCSGQPSLLSPGQKAGPAAHQELASEDQGEIFL